MSKSLYLTPLLLILSISYSFSQQSFEPIELAKKIFSKTELKDLSSYCFGEYKGKPNGKDISESASLHFLLLEQTNMKAVVTMTILDSSGKGLDTYLHFTKDKIWKLEAFRALAMTGILEKVKEDMGKMTESQIDSLIAYRPSQEKDFILFKDREDFNFKLGNINLTLALDSEIIAHFIKNSFDFNRIKDSIIASQKLNSDKVEISKETQALMKKLYVDYEGSHYANFDNCITFLIGGMLDNVVGYLYCTNKDKLPKMDPSRLIMLREIGGGWYIFKTT